MTPIPDDDVTPDDQRRAGEALRASFARLAPQGSDEWNFMGAFTLLGDRFGPYQPGASDLGGEASGAGVATGGRRGGGRLARLRAAGSPSAPTTGPEADKSDFDEAMGHIIEAFRFLHARVSTLEERIANEDVPLDGAAWLAPARELGPWIDPVATYVRAHTPGGEVVHADCGSGGLVLALMQGGTPARGVEPRGAIALGALEHGADVTISEVGDYLATRSKGSLGGLVLGGVIDRLPLHGVIPLLAQSRRALAEGAPLVVVSEALPGPAHGEPITTDLVDGRSLHRQTWGLLLERSGFVDVGDLGAAQLEVDDRRFGLTATTPST
jgi:hypothetical protein